ncbi:hypothetical protein ACFE04_030970 [Oxalis oulophora]
MPDTAVHSSQSDRQGSISSLQTPERVVQVKTSLEGMHEHPKPQSNLPPAVAVPAVAEHPKPRSNLPLAVVVPAVAEHSKPRSNLPLAVAVPAVEEHPKPRSDLLLTVVVPATEEKNVAAVLAKAEKKSVISHVKSPRQIEPKDAPEHSDMTAHDQVKCLQLQKTRDELQKYDTPSPKRPKKDNFVPDAFPIDKPSREHRTVVQTESQVDIVNDGYRWRKYGQKIVKGSPNPRTVTHNATTRNAESGGAKSLESETLFLQDVDRNGSDPESKIIEDSKNKPGGSDVVTSDVIQDSSDHKTVPDDQRTSKSDAVIEKPASTTDTVKESSSAEIRPSEE